MRNYVELLFNLHTSYNFAHKVTTHVASFGERHFRGNGFDDLGADFLQQTFEQTMMYQYIQYV